MDLTLTTCSVDVLPEPPTVSVPKEYADGNVAASCAVGVPVMACVPVAVVAVVPVRTYMSCNLIG